MTNIVIAENELGLREFIARGLVHRGYKVVRTADGSEALAAIKREPFDLLISDIDMPIMDGIDLAIAAHALRPKMLIVIMSAHEHQLERARALNVPIAHVISKPFTIAQICAVAESVLLATKP